MEKRAEVTLLKETGRRTALEEEARFIIHTDMMLAAVTPRTGVSTHRQGSIPESTFLSRKPREGVTFERVQSVKEGSGLMDKAGKKEFIRFVVHFVVIAALCVVMGFFGAVCLDEDLWKYD